MNNTMTYNVSSMTLFDSLNASQQHAIIQISKVATFKKYNYIYKAGDESNNIYFLIEGRVKLCSYNESGKELIKTIHYPKEMFGEEAVLSLNEREDFAIAMDKSIKVLVIKSNDFKLFMCQNPSVSIEVTSTIGNKLKHAQKRIENFIFKSARNRIIDFIKDLAIKQGQQIGYEILIKNFLTHNEIASLIGTSRQTVTIVLSELKKTNKIYIDRKNVLVRDLNNLQ